VMIQESRSAPRVVVNLDRDHTAATALADVLPLILANPLRRCRFPFAPPVPVNEPRQPTPVAVEPLDPDRRPAAAGAQGLPVPFGRPCLGRFRSTTFRTELLPRSACLLVSFDAPSR
jgi:hypothetical protein